MPAQPRWKKFIASHFFLLMLLASAVVLLFASVRAYLQNYETRQEVARLQEEAKKLEAKKLNLLEILDYVRSPAFAEEKARTELNMIKPGEKTAIIFSEKSVSKKIGQDNEEVVKWDDTPNIVKWWNYFLKRE